MNSIVHLFSGPSAAGSLRYYFEKSQIEGEKVAAIADDTSVGPIYDIGLRTEFLTKIARIVAPNDADLLTYLTEGVVGWPEPKNYSDRDIIIWHSPNVAEQMMLRLVVSQLQESNLYEIDLSKSQSQTRGTGEYTPYQLGAFLDKKTLLSVERKIGLSADWDKLAADRSVLRIFESGSIMPVSENYYDETILAECRNVYLPAARVIGNVLGKSEQAVSDTWIEYRLKYLITEGILDYEGSLDSMRTYSIAKCEV